MLKFTIVWRNPWWEYYNYKLKARGGGGGVLNKVLTGRIHSKVQLHTLLYVTFDKGTPLFVYPLLANDTPFTYLVNASLR